jgi:hypothetical protein
VTVQTVVRNVQSKAGVSSKNNKPYTLFTIQTDHGTFKTFQVGVGQQAQAALTAGTPVEVDTEQRGNDTMANEIRPVAAGAGAGTPTPAPAASPPYVAQAQQAQAAAPPRQSRNPRDFRQQQPYRCLDNGDLFASPRDVNIVRQVSWKVAAQVMPPEIANFDALAKIACQIERHILRDVEKYDGWDDGIPFEVLP